MKREIHRSTDVTSHFIEPTWVLATATAESYASQIGSAAAAATTTENVFTDSADAVATTTITKNVFTDSADPRMECAALPTHVRCYNYGGKRHPKDNRCHCPARDKICRNCSKLDHFAKVCRSTEPTPSRSTSAVIVARVKDGDRSSHHY